MIIPSIRPSQDYPMPQSPLLLRRLLRAKDKMDGAPHQDWSAARLAEVSAVSPAYFAREFKQAFGLPPHRYLLTRRIERASALLRDTDLPITEIALQTGWTSLGTFGRIFRDITGASPGELRASQRAAPVARDMPECLMREAQRPQLKTSVLEKRRAKAAGKLQP
jgi:transcriptional regulator GlxA family with amidase domain